MATWRDVRRFGLALPGVVEKTTYDANAAWTVGGKLFAWERPLRRADIAALGDDAPRGSILGVQNARLSPHFDGYPAVLVRLEKIGARHLEQVIVVASLSRALKRLVNGFMKAKAGRSRRPPR